MDLSALIAIEPLLVLVGVLAFAWWQFRELNQLKREREQREAEEARTNREEPPADRS